MNPISEYLKNAQIMQLFDDSVALTSAIIMVGCVLNCLFVFFVCNRERADSLKVISVSLLLPICATSVMSMSSSDMIWGNATNLLLVMICSAVALRSLLSKSIEPNDLC